ncbi:MAG: capsular biosynthesis protein [Agathobacter sp.]|nr:capsular biosynthesis protein [Agathobacter sp.]
MIDIHTHLLFGVDDGPKTMEESIEMLKSAKAQGVDAMILTPHYRHGMFAYPNEEIEANFAKLMEPAKKIGIELYLGTEHHVNSMMLEYIESGRVRTLANTQYVLAEYKHDTEFEYIAKSVRDLLRNGYIPIVAHVERYMCMHEDLERIDWLRDVGAMIQVNANAILGMEGFKTKSFTKKLLKYGYIDFVGSDSHDMKKRANNLGKCRDYLYKKYDERYVDKITYYNALEILEAIGE